ncbi:MAG TPA: hypothetical protein VKH15_10395 [Candidatus Acidoferrum sp.]|nr:hypothetical protein [Candidatus Acidoferrum sp.]
MPTHSVHASLCLPVPDQSQKQSNRMLWAGLAFLLLAILSNVLSFFRLSPALLPWVIFALPILALVFLLIGLVRAFRQPQIHKGKIWGSIVTVLAILLVAASTLFFVGARKLPSSGGAPQVGQHVPDFTLSDSTGQPTTLAQLFSASATAGAPPPKAVLLVFYRGYW